MMFLIACVDVIYFDHLFEFCCLYVKIFKDVVALRVVFLQTFLLLVSINLYQLDLGFSLLSNYIEC